MAKSDRPSKSDAPAVVGTQEASAHWSAGDDADAVAQPFIGQWNHLISTTNWEKGRIICEWRAALMTAGAPVSAYSDEAWANQVGGVTSQHVGRLRRAFQRFGEAYQQYDGLFWSHFQASLDWDDAEMWLEGAIQNEWSVSQMRGKRWEVVGAPGQPAPVEEPAELEGVAEDAAEPAADASETSTVTANETRLQSLDAESAPRDKETRDEQEDREQDAAAPTDGDAAATAATSKPARKRLSVEVDELPDDLAEAFEQFKLAIIAQRREGWCDTQPETVVECLDALRELALAPLD